jgi:hypothetical protein
MFHWPSPDHGEEPVSFGRLIASLNPTEQGKGAENREIVAGVIQPNLAEVDLAETPGPRVCQRLHKSRYLEVAEVMPLDVRPRNAIV